MIRLGVCLLLDLGLLLRAASSSALCLALPHDYTWPSPDCFNGLQACIDSEPCNGGIVEIATNPEQPITDPISFQKGLTLRAFPGYHPVFTVPISASTPTEGNGRVGYDIHFEGLTFQGAGISVVQNSESTLSLEVVGNTISSAGDAIDVSDGSGTGIVAFDVSGNTITAAKDPIFPNGNGISFDVSEARGRVANNTIAIAAGDSFASAVAFQAMGTTSTLDAIANQISGSTYSIGIAASMSSASSGDEFDVRILDNRVTGGTGNGAAQAIALDGGSAILHATVVGNTVSGNADGIDASANGGMVSGTVENNIVSLNSTSGISIDPSQSATLTNRNNVVFANGSNSFSPGPVTIATDPLFVGNGDYHLQPGSPALNAGDDGAVPADLTTDLDGRPRILGSHVDMGAYESGPLVWPAARAPCNASDGDAGLQACVDAAVSGDEVQIATNADAPILETISFAKSLTLRAAPGFAPLFASYQRVEATTQDTGSTAVTIEGLAFQYGGISALQQSVDPLTVRIADNTLVGSFGDSITVSSMPSGGSGSIAFDISGNAMHSGSNGITVNTPGQNASGRIAGNSIAMNGPDASAIRFLNGGPSSSVDVVGNRISGLCNAGIGIYPQTADASLTTRILDNLVTGQVSRVTPGPGAIILVGSGAPLDATVVNNTAADNGDGIIVDAVAGTISGLLANNIASGHTGAGIGIQGAGATVSNRNNLVFANGADSFTPGPGTLHSDPHFVGNGDFHLAAGSPAIDAGDDGAVPGDLTTDLDGSPRLQGRVDIGAYETVPEPVGSSAWAVAALASLSLSRSRRA